MITIYDYTKFKPEGEVERVLKFACTALEVDDITVVATLNEKMLKRLSRGDIEYKAVVFKNKGVSNIYTIYFCPNLSVSTYREILFHEAVHLAQQQRGDLSLNLTTGDCWWHGEKYRSDFPYMQRPWEKEAFKVQSDILRQYKKSKKIK